jgi:pyruvate-formate lyase
MSSDDFPVVGISAWVMKTYPDKFDTLLDIYIHRKLPDGRMNKAAVREVLGDEVLAVWKARTRILGNGE